MKNYIFDFAQFQMIEKLHDEDWSNYGEETSVSNQVHADDLQEEPDDIRQTLVVIEHMLGLNADDVLVTGLNMGSGGDMKYFHDNIIIKSDVIDKKALTFDTHVQYFTLYQYEDKKYIVMDVKDYTEYSFIFINKEDFDFFDQIQPANTPKEPENIELSPDEEMIDET